MPYRVRSRAFSAARSASAGNSTMYLYQLVVEPGGTGWILAAARSASASSYLAAI
jgi:hypothetical protein